MGEDEPIRMCIEQRLPDELRIEAMERAIEERPENLPIVPPGAGGPPDPKELALLTRSLWKAGRTLRVRFLDGDPVVQAKVAQQAHRWSEFANIYFDFGDDPNAEIRITFRQAGSWSYLGTQALSIAPGQPTMCYGWLTPTSADQEYERVVVHEFGHALGCIHEHQNPAGGIPWDEAAVIAYYGRAQGWSEEKVRHNLLKRYAATETQFSSFDRDSIMLYPIPNQVTIGDFEVGWNRTLSEMDKAFIQRVYPFEPGAIVPLTVGAAPVEGAIDTPGEEDTYRLVVSEAGRYTVETSGATDVMMGLFGPNSRTSQLFEDDDSGERFNARIAADLQPGLYYVRVRHYNPQRKGGYQVWASRG